MKPRSTCKMAEKSFPRCSFSSFSSIICGPSIYFPLEDNIVPVKDCVRDISIHLKSVGIGNVLSEGHLLCFRVGIFPFMRDYMVCPQHRYALGIRWKRKSICAHPNHTGNARPETGRGVTVDMSSAILRSSGCVVPIGSGMPLLYQMFSLSHVCPQSIL